MKFLKMSYPNFFFLVVFASINLTFLLMPVDLDHMWRQADTASVARNFIQESFNIFLPRVDIRGALTGITGMEFPLYNWIVAVLSFFTTLPLTFLGKLLSLLSAIIFFISFEKVYNTSKTKKEIFFITAISSPLLFIWSTKFMPETFSLAFTYLGLLLFYDYEEDQKTQTFILSAILLAVAFLVRPYYIFTGFVLISYLFRRFSKTKEIDFKVLFGGMIILLLFYLWYGYWSQYLKLTYNLEYYFEGKSLSKSIKELLEFETIKEGVILIFFKLSNFIMLPFLIFGIISFVQGGYKEKKALDLFCSFALTLVAIPLLVGDHFIFHSYYLLPLSPFLIYLTCKGLTSDLFKEITKKDWVHLLMAIFMLVISMLVFKPIVGKYKIVTYSWFIGIIFLLIAFSYSRLSFIFKNKLIRIFFVLISLGVGLGIWKSKIIKPSSERLGVEKIYQEVQERTKPDDLIAIYHKQFSYPFFMLNRKGWARLPGSYEYHQAELRTFRDNGAKWVIKDSEDKSKLVLVPIEEIIGK